MSSGGSSSGSSFSSRRSTIVQENLGDDVSIATQKEGVDFGALFWRLILCVLFVGAGVGAIVYAVTNADDTSDSSHENHTETISYFMTHLNQYCDKNGTLTRTERQRTVTGDYRYVSTKIGAFWAQDDTKKRLFHKIGIEEYELDAEYYVFEDFTYFVKYNVSKVRPPFSGICQNNAGAVLNVTVTCTRDDTLYYDIYMDKMGLAYLAEKRVEEVLIDEKYRAVTVFEGEPSLSVIINGDHPQLVRGYSDELTGVSLGWEAYFATDATSLQHFREEYWFPEMVLAEPEDITFYNIPSICFH